MGLTPRRPGRLIVGRNVTLTRVLSQVGFVPPCICSVFMDLVVEFCLLFQCEAVLGVFMFSGFNLPCFLMALCCTLTF
jgi:hypothetical protein